jgi:phospholipid transport system substrate-binding protein
MTRLRLLLVAPLLAALAFAPSAFAKPDVERSAKPTEKVANPEAEKFVQDRQKELLGHIKDKANAKITLTFDEMLDYPWLTQQSLKDFWGERTPKEREEFQCVLRQLVTDAHRKNLSKVLGYDVTFQGTTKADEGFLVTTVAKNRSNAREEPITIAYRVHKVDGKWRVYDIVTEGSSLVDNYRNQFRRIIKKNGYPELVRRMRNKLGKAADKCPPADDAARK